VALQKQPQREILHCGSYSEDSEGFGLKVSFESGLHMSHVDYDGPTYEHFVNYLCRPG